MRKPMLIKAGGELFAKPEVRRKVLWGIKQCRLQRPVVLVHGGGPQIEQEFIKAKIPVRFVNGRRVTTPAAMEIVERVLSGDINKGIAADLTRMHLRAVGISCRDTGLVEALPIKGLGRAAKPSHVNVAVINALLEGGFMPVVSSVGMNEKTGESVNINADDAASVIANALQVSQLIFLSNIPGVLDKNKKRIPVLKISAIDGLIASGVITGGMIPKVTAARASIERGVGEVVILNGLNGVKLNSGTRIIAS